MGLYPLESVDEGFLLIEVDLFDHAGALFHFEQFEVVDDVFDVESLLLIEQDYQRYGLELSFAAEQIDEELFFFVEGFLVVDEEEQCLIGEECYH